MLVGLLLSYAAVSKAASIPLFAFVIKSGVPFAGSASTPTLFVMGQVIVFVEILVGISLVVHFYSSLMRRVAVILFMAFTVVLVMLLVRGKPISCGCLGFSPSGMGSRAEIWFGIIRNVCLVMMLVAVGMWSKEQRRLNEQVES